MSEKSLVLELQMMESSGNDIERGTTVTTWTVTTITAGLSTVSNHC